MRQQQQQRLYQVGAFAALTGVSVRTLHHYDQIGLLRPSGRSEAGYRLYAEDDLLTLQQILTLRYLGFGLKQIRELLNLPDFDLVASLRIQRRALRDRITELEHIATVLGQLLERRLATGQWNWEQVAQASATVQAGLDQRGKHMSDYYTPEEMQQAMKKLAAQVTPEEIARTEEQWTALVREVRANRDLDPADPNARELADRWHALYQPMGQLYNSDPKLAATIQRNYEQNAYVSIPEAPTMEDFAFIERVDQARSGS